MIIIIIVIIIKINNHNHNINNNNNNYWQTIGRNTRMLTSNYISY